jgi:hypothetical protein
MTPFSQALLNPLSIEQCARLDPERLRQLVNDRNRRISSTPFEVAYVGAVDLSLESEPLLRPALFEPKATQISAKAPANVHA